MTWSRHSLEHTGGRRVRPILSEVIMLSVTRGSRRVKALLGPVVAVFLVAGCSAADTPSRSGDEVHGGGDVAARQHAKAEKPARSQAEGGGAGSSSKRGAAGSQQGPAEPADTNARIVTSSRDVIYRGSVTVRVKNVEAAVRRAEQIVADAGGVVHAERTSTEGPDGTSRASLTVRVPPTEFRAVMAKISAELGVGLRRSQTAEDVTTQVVDTASRIETQRTSVRRVRLLLDRATNLDDIMRLETEVARREADLESLEAQLARLKDLTAEATIEVELVEKKARVIAKPRDEQPDTGFLVGFRGGWKAFVEIVQVALTVVGALLPFALTGALVAAPVWFLLRARLRRRPDVSPEVPAL